MAWFICKKCKSRFGVEGIARGVSFDDHFIVEAREEWPHAIKRATLFYHRVWRPMMEAAFQ